MKKSTNFLLAAIGLFSMMFIPGKAQTALNNREVFYSNESGKLNETSTTPFIYSYGKAEKNFAATYYRAVNAEWLTLNDKSLMCRFFIDNIMHRAFYTPKGRWLGTVAGYEGSKLNKSVSNSIKTGYYNFSIAYVNQIDLAGRNPIYIVEIRNEKSIKKLLVENDEIQVIQEFE